MTNAEKIAQELRALCAITNPNEQLRVAVLRACAELEKRESGNSPMHTNDNSEHLWVERWFQGWSANPQFQVWTEQPPHDRADHYVLASRHVRDVQEPWRKVDELADLLGEARLQIEYLHKKFQETSSGNGVLVQIDYALSTLKRGQV